MGASHSQDKVTSANFASLWQLVRFCAAVEWFCASIVECAMIKQLNGGGGGLYFENNELLPPPCLSNTYLKSKRVLSFTLIAKVKGVVVKKLAPPMTCFPHSSLPYNQVSCHVQSVSKISVHAHPLKGSVRSGNTQGLLPMAPKHIDFGTTETCQGSMQPVF